MSSCLLNTANIKPSPDEYSNLIDTPVYVKKAPDKDVATYQNDLNQCRSESDIKQIACQKLVSVLDLGGCCLAYT